MAVFTKRKNPAQDRSRETVDTILQAVVELVDSGQSASESLTTTRIAERAGVSVGSLYQYFPGKEAIFSALIEWHLRKEAQLVASALAGLETQRLEDAVDQMLSALLAVRKRNVRIEQALFRFFSRTGDLEILTRYDSVTISDLDRTLTAAAERGHVARDGTTAFLLLHAIRSAFIAATVQRPELYQAPDELLGGLRRIVLALLKPAQRGL